MVVYTGKILSDDTKISDCNIDPKKFVVVMVSKTTGAASGDKLTTLPSTSTSDKPTERYN